HHGNPFRSACRARGSRGAHARWALRRRDGALAMWRNYLAAALRNLFRNRAYAAINILGLAVGFAAAILIGLFVRDELSYDRMWPDADRMYRLSWDLLGQPRASLGNADPRLGPALKLDFPEVEATA